jgi:dephospho-CoA kinase
MIKLGILGQVGAGKSYVAQIFKNKGFPIFNADQEVSKIYKRNFLINKKISSYFNVALVNGKVKKEDLKTKLLEQPNKFKFLNNVIHPIVRKNLKHFLKKNKNKTLVVLDIPLLIENKMFEFVDLLIFVKTKKTTIRKRLEKRGLNKEFLAILKSQQLSDKEKIKYSDFIVINNKNTNLKSQINDILNKIILNDD